MKLITERIENVEVLKEAKEDGKTEYFIEGIFMQADVGNRNKRVYPKDVLMPEVNRYIKEVINEGRSVGELGHPEGPQINLDRVSHKIVELKESGSNVIGRAKVLNTPFGKIVKEFIDEGVKIGVSSRALGSLKQSGDLQEVQNDFMLSTVDIVHDPSAPDAFVEGLMEGKEWIVENGIIKEVDIDMLKRHIHKASSRELQEAKIQAMEEFFKKLARGY